MKRKYRAVYLHLDKKNLTKTDFKNYKDAEKYILKHFCEDCKKIEKESEDMWNCHCGKLWDIEEE
jgi:ribosomal protein L37AE/L43A